MGPLRHSSEGFATGLRTGVWRRVWVSPLNPQKCRNKLGGFKKALRRGFLQKHLNPIRGPFLGDSVRILGVCPAVSPTFGL